jgi:hypothetical protein
MFYFKITTANAEFVAAINHGIKPELLDEEGKPRYCIVYTNGLVKIENEEEYLSRVAQVGTRISFQIA